MINAQIPSIENAIIALFFTSHILYNSIMCHVAYVCILVAVVVVVVGGIGKHALLHPLHHNSPSWRERERENIHHVSSSSSPALLCSSKKDTVSRDFYHLTFINNWVNDDDGGDNLFSQQISMIRDY